MDTPQFYTLKGYEREKGDFVTAAMEDYLEMICRLSGEGDGPVRIRALSRQLHVKPSSASKMVSNLRERGLIEVEKYGEIHLTPDGKAFGEYLLYRHALLHRFFCYLNQTQDELEQVEKIEHFVEERTVRNIQAFLDSLERVQKEAPLSKKASAP